MAPPQPLRTDGSNAFARHSMQVRVPRIARDVVERAEYPSEVRRDVEKLAQRFEKQLGGRPVKVLGELAAGVAPRSFEGRGAIGTGCSGRQHLAVLAAAEKAADRKYAGGFEFL